MKLQIACPDCKGTGLQLPLCDGPCSDCGGSGQIVKEFKDKDSNPLPDTPDGKLVSQLCDLDELNDWETEFCIDMESWVEHRSLTTAQRSKINQILEKYR
jgi:hypothetical protein